MLIVISARADFIYDLAPLHDSAVFISDSCRTRESNFRTGVCSLQHCSRVPSICRSHANERQTTQSRPRYGTKQKRSANKEQKAVILADFRAFQVLRYTPAAIHQMKDHQEPQQR